MTLHHDVPTGLRIDSFIASGSEGGGRFCSLDTAAAQFASTWSKAGNAWALELKSFSMTSHLEVRVHRRGVSIELIDVWGGLCGFGAEWPRSIEVDKGSSSCTVVY